MNGHAVPLTGSTPLCPLMVLPELTFTHGAGDHSEPNSLKSPSCIRFACPNCATTPAVCNPPKSKDAAFLSMSGPSTAMAACCVTFCPLSMNVQDRA